MKYLFYQIHKLLLHNSNEIKRIQFRKVFILANLIENSVNLTFVSVLTFPGGDKIDKKTYKIYFKAK